MSNILRNSHVWNPKVNTSKDYLKKSFPKKMQFFQVFLVFFFQV